MWTETGIAKESMHDSARIMCAQEVASWEQSEHTLDTLPGDDVERVSEEQVIVSR